MYNIYDVTRIRNKTEGTMGDEGIIVGWLRYQCTNVWVWRQTWWLFASWWVENCLLLWTCHIGRYVPVLKMLQHSDLPGSVAFPTLSRMVRMPPKKHRKTYHSHTATEYWWLTDGKTTEQHLDRSGYWSVGDLMHQLFAMHIRQWHSISTMLQKRRCPWSSRTTSVNDSAEESYDDGDSLNT